MKNIFKKIIISSVAILTLSSCEDAIDIVQEGEMNDDITFQTVDDLGMYLTGSVYSNFDNSDALFLSAQLTDELGIGPDNSELSQSAHQYYLDATNSYVSSIWIGNYTVINRVNRLLEGAEKITPTTSAETASYNNIIAQAKLVRAFAYFTLESFFSTDMTDDTALGVIYVDNVPDMDEKKPRVANSEIFALIDSDIAYAESNLEDDNGGYYYIGKDFLNAFKARYYLYRGKYSEAKTAAQTVINTSGLSLTQATPIPSGTAGSTAWHTSLNSYSSTNPYEKMLNDSSQGEIIFALSRPSSQSWGNIASYFSTNSTSSSGSTSYDMGRKIFNILDAAGGDIRRYAYIDPTSKIATDYATSESYRTDDELIIDKYPGKYTGTQGMRNDLKIFRLSEMYFILAECLVEENDFSGAAALIKKVRDARNFLGATELPTYSTKQAALQDILLERRKELFVEGHRYLDLKRIGAAAGVAIDRDATDDLKTVATTLPIDDYRMRSFPIPNNEIEGNPDIVQNPGY